MRHLKLVIVDDEPILLSGLVETYDWEQMGYVVAGTAESGEKALEVIEHTLPDVVLSDIRMKQITGLMVMEQIKKTYPDILFIFISAYRDFEYAQKACEMQAFSYLSKPIEEEKLYETMNAAHKACMERIQSQQEQDNIKRIMLEDSDSFLQIVIQKYLRKQFTEEKMREVMSFINYEIQEQDVFLSICADIDISCKITNPLDYEAARYRLLQYLNRKLKKHFVFWTFENQNGSQIYLLHSKTEIEPLYIKKTMERSKNEISEEIISSISRGYKGFEGLRKSYEEAVRLFEYASASGAGAFTVSKEVQEEFGDSAGKEPYLPNEEILILNAIRKNDERQLKKALIHFIYSFHEENGLKLLYLHRLMLQVEILLRDTYGMTEKLNDSFQSYYSNIGKLSETQAVDVCYKMLSSIVEERKSNTGKEELCYFSEYMSVAIGFIEENLEEESLSIVTVAKQIYLNPVYFGRVFKNTFHMTFKQYLLKQRMERAVRLIMEGEESMAYVCEKVGIASPSYFSQVFKQYTGFLPSEYKVNIVQ